MHALAAAAVGVKCERSNVDEPVSLFVFYTFYTFLHIALRQMHIFTVPKWQTMAVTRRRDFPDVISLPQELDEEKGN